MTSIWSRLRVNGAGHRRVGARGDGFERSSFGLYCLSRLHGSSTLNLGHRRHHCLYASLIAISGILSGTNGTLYPSVRHTLPNLFPLDPISDPFYLFSTTVHSFASLPSKHGTAAGGVNQQTSVLGIFPLRSLTR